MADFSADPNYENILWSKNNEKNVPRKWWKEMF
jgi:hypothetical protein